MSLENFLQILALFKICESWNMLGQKLGVGGGGIFSIVISSYFTLWQRKQKLKNGQMN